MIVHSRSQAQRRGKSHAQVDDSHVVEVRALVEAGMWKHLQSGVFKMWRNSSSGKRCW